MRKPLGDSIGCEWTHKFAAVDPLASSASALAASRFAGLRRLEGEMKTLLRIDASAQRQGSHSRALADYYQAAWERANSHARVITRDLAAEPPPHLDDETIAVFYAGGDVGDGLPPAGIRRSDELIAELKDADHVLVSSAVYNFNVPSALKAWIDHIVRFGHTLSPGPRGPIGKLSGRSACLVTARGGTAESSPDFQGPSMRAVFEYLGFDRIDWVSLEGTKIPDGQLEARIAEARGKLDALFEAAPARK